MSIRVTCPGCHKRFQVSDEHGGKTGACPDCKSPIQIPEKSEEVVIHAPDGFGPKDSSGRAVLKPIEHQDAQLSPVGIAAIIGTIVVMFVLAFMIGRASGEAPPPWWVMAIGAVLVAPPVCWGGYSVLRDDERGAFRGSELYLRLGICAVLYATLWGGYALTVKYLLGGSTPELFQLAFIVPAFLVVGGGLALGALELDFTNGCLHYGFYVLVTVLLQACMGHGWIPG